MRPNGPKGPIFRPKMPILGQIWTFLDQKKLLWGKGAKLLVPSGTLRKPMRHLFRVENIDRWGSNGCYRHFFHFLPYCIAKTDFFYFAHFALRCQEHGVCQNVHLPKVSPIQHILAQNPIFPIFADGLLVDNAWWPFLDPFLDPSQYLSSFQSYSL